MYDIINGDALAEMKKMPAESFDLVITSPPYNLLNSCGGGAGKFCKSNKLYQDAGYDDYGDNMPYDQYVEWQRECLSEMLRLVPDDGAVFYNHKWRTQNKLIQNRKEIVKDFPVRQIIIWARGGGINFNKCYFLPTYEVIYVIAKPDFRFLENDIGDIWRIQPDNFNPHPAPFPMELPHQIISLTNAQKILDPFCGSASTGIASLALKREFTGIEKSPKFHQMGLERLERYYHENIANSLISMVKPNV